MPADKTIRTRFAPTPSGFLHQGNAFNFILTWLLAKKQNGNILLRIDDMDSTRSRPEYIDDVFANLEWLELSWNEGPKNATEFNTHYSQKLCLEDYRQNLAKLSTDLYSCDCSRSQIKLQSGSLIYPGICRHKRLAYVKDKTSRKIIIQDDDLFSQTGDITLWRKDDLPAYQLVSVLEDEWQKINLVVRGMDLALSTKIQLYLAKKLSCQFFPHATIIHHPLLADQFGNKLSKSQGASDLRTLRLSAGHTEKRAEIFRNFCQFFQLPISQRADELLKLDDSIVSRLWRMDLE